MMSGSKREGTAFLFMCSIENTNHERKALSLYSHLNGYL